MALYTTCPGCKRQFKLRAGHLAAASGEVRCGFCKLRFNALQNLDDAPGMPAREPHTGNTGVATVKKKRRKRSGKKQGATVAGESTDHDAVVRTYELQLASTGKEMRQSAANRSWWLAGVMVFSIVLAIQSVWHYRNHLYVSYPDLISYAHALCQKLPCGAIRQVGLNNIELVNRDVRFHPRYQDALLVNATIVNRSNAYMPLPLVEIQIYDRQGEHLGWRRFRPEEYMGEDDHVMGMRPDDPVYIVLELAGDVAAADGFELGFAYPQGLLFFTR